MSTTFHPLSDADRGAMVAAREFMQSMPSMTMTPDARPFYDEMIRQMPQAEGIQYTAGELGGVPGWWCRLDGAPDHSVLLYLHGGGYVLGSAEAYRNTAGQFAANAGVHAFALEYRLAPEHHFPCAVDDVIAAYDALVAQGFTRIAIAGDSAGGGLTLALLAAVNDRAVRPVAAVAVSPWTDMTASGDSMHTRSEVDPMLDREKMTSTAALYLDGADPFDPKASPLFASLDGLAPVLIHVGDDEVLLDDSVRYADTMASVNGNVELHVWEGMIHVFTASIAMLEAAREAMSGIGEFLATRLLKD